MQGVIQRFPNNECESMSAVPPSKGFSLADANTRFDMGFPSLVGFHFLEWEEGRAVLGLQIETRHLNLGGVIHGGVLATLMDVAGACAGTWSPDPAHIRKAEIGRASCRERV